MKPVKNIIYNIINSYAVVGSKLMTLKSIPFITIQWRPFKLHLRKAKLFDLLWFMSPYKIGSMSWEVAIKEILAHANTTISIMTVRDMRIYIFPDRNK